MIEKGQELPNNNGIVIIEAMAHKCPQVGHIESLSLENLIQFNRLASNPSETSRGTVSDDLGMLDSNPVHFSMGSRTAFPRARMLGIPAESGGFGKVGGTD